LLTEVAKTHQPPPPADDIVTPAAEATVTPPPLPSSSPLLMLTPAGAEMLTPVAPDASTQELTLAHVSAQLERFLWDRGCA